MPGVFKIKNLEDAEFTLTHPDGVGAVSIDSNNIAKSDAVNAALALKANTADLKEIGVGQTLQTFTVGVQRISGSNYNNTTGKPIWIIVAMTAGAGAALSITAGGALRVVSVPDNVGATRVIVPILNGEIYSATAIVGAINYWAEIR